MNVHTICTDFSKAFDMVDHEILIDKLSHYGVKGKILDWFRSYLSDRHLQVRVNGHISAEYEVTSGVPQGSHLGPIFFNIFINDIGNEFVSEYLLYADDLKIFRKINGVEDVKILQRDIDELHRWCMANKLKININKCVVMSFSRSTSWTPAIYHLNQHQLVEVTSVKDLGVMVDNKFNFTKHIDKITSQACRTLRFILRSGREFNDVHTLILLFMSLVRPVLEYCTTIWSPRTQVQIEKVEKIQKNSVNMCHITCTFEEPI